MIFCCFIGVSALIIIHLDDFLLTVPDLVMYSTNMQFWWIYTKLIFFVLNCVFYLY